ncbi:MAG: T9SS type A sorting domain-containing protein, partial [Prolixibacteraceae bacterium]|nr:T9SS type A sorting domain-containing protein [Prolixibacteraceae bacterium]
IRLSGDNYILQNLTLGPSNADVINISGGTNVFITKCVFHDSKDELCSMVQAADYVTVSWSHFYFDEPDSHSFAHLIGNSDDNTGDRGKLHVTFHHNWYDYGIDGRVPRVRFGHVHIYNCYYNSTGNDYCIGTGFECNIRVENCYFENTNNLWKDQNGVGNGATIGWDNLELVEASVPNFIPNSYPVFDLPYTFEPDEADKVKAIVKERAGNVFGNIPGSYQLEIITPADSAKFANNASILIEAQMKDPEKTLTSVGFYCDTLLLTDNEAPYSFEWKNLPPGHYKIWAMGTTAVGITVRSEEKSVYVADGVYISLPEDGQILKVYENTSIVAEAWFYESNVAKVDFYEGNNLIFTDTEKPYTCDFSDMAAGSYVFSVKATDDQDVTIEGSFTVSVEVTGGPDGYEFCSVQGEQCSTEKLVDIAFGADGQFNYIYNVSDKTDCNSDVFGDPIPGVEKACYVKEAPTPYVMITFPADGKEYNAPAQVQIYAKAFDNDGTIDSVEFYGNDDYIGSASVNSNKTASFKWSDVPGGSYLLTAKVIDNEGNIAASDPIYVTVMGGNSIIDHKTGYINVYPNPANNKLTILIENCPDNAGITLVDINGNAILQKFSEGKKSQIEMHGLPSGVYFVIISNGDERIVKRIIKN